MRVGERPTPAGLIGSALLAFVTVSACREPPVVEAPTYELRVRPLTVDRTIHGDTRFEREERLLAEYACESWQRFSAGRIRFAIVWDYDEHRFVDLAEQPHMVRLPLYLVPQHGLERVAGRVDGNEIRVAADACPELFPCMLHELGHFAGLDDLDVDGVVMSRRRTGWTFKYADKVECIRVGLCEGPP